MEWHNIFKVIKGKNLQPRILYTKGILFRVNREIKDLQKTKNLKRIKQQTSSITTNAKETSLGGKEMATIKQNYKWENLLIK